MTVCMGRPNCKGLYGVTELLGFVWSDRTIWSLYVETEL